MTNKYQILCCCLKCKKVTTTGQLSRNHSVMCPTLRLVILSPNLIKKTAWNKGLSKETDTRVKNNGEKISKTLKSKSTVLTQEQKNHLSKIAKARGFCGYQPKAGISKKFYVPDSFGKITCLQSTYELRCSKILDTLNIKWIRPSALKYDGKNYFADFYLPDFDLYLDPKNKYKARLDMLKIEKVKQQNNVKVFVLLDKDLTIEHIQSLCS